LRPAHRPDSRRRAGSYRCGQQIKSALECRACLSSLRPLLRSAVTDGANHSGAQAVGPQGNCPWSNARRTSCSARATQGRPAPWSRTGLIISTWRPTARREIAPATLTNLVAHARRPTGFRVIQGPAVHQAQLAIFRFSGSYRPLAVVLHQHMPCRPHPDQPGAQFDGGRPHLFARTIMQAAHSAVVSENSACGFFPDLPAASSPHASADARCHRRNTTLGNSAMGQLSQSGGKILIGRAARHESPPQHLPACSSYNLVSRGSSMVNCGPTRVSPSAYQRAILQRAASAASPGRHHRATFKTFYVIRRSQSAVLALQRRIRAANPHRGGSFPARA